MNKNYWTEIRNDHFVTAAHTMPEDGDVQASIAIDAWKTTDGWEGGTVIAEVFLSKNGDILVAYKDPVARIDVEAQKAIEDAKRQLREYWYHLTGYPEVNHQVKIATLLNCRFFARDVFLKKLKPVLSQPDEPWDGCYQFMRKQACFVSYQHLKDTLELLARANVITPVNAAIYIGNIQEKLVQEFAECCPPPEGKCYKFAGTNPEGDLMLRICDMEQQ